MTDATDDLELKEMGLDRVPDGTDYFWTTKDGKRLNIRNMETSHIRNCIRMLNRAIASRPDEYAWGEPEGDMAQDAFNAGIRNNDILEEEMRETIGHLHKELKRRGEYER